MKLTLIVRLGTMLFTLWFTTGCQTSSDDDWTDPTKTALPQSSNLQALSHQDLENFIKSGLVRAYEEPPLVYMEDDMVTAQEDAGGGGNSEPTSSTNVIEAGVDEADWVKFHQGHLYAAYNPEWYGGWFDVYETQGAKYAPARLEIAQLSSTPSQRRLSPYAFDLSDNANWISGIYTDSDRLTVLSAVSEPNDNWASAIVWRGGGTQIEQINIADPEAVSSAWKLKLDGYLVDSRRVENKLYLVTRFSPWVNGLEFGKAKDNHDLLSDIDLSQMLPTITHGGVTETLIGPNGCMGPAHKSWQNFGYYTFTHVTEVDLNDPSQWSTQCVLTPVNSISVTAKSLYLVDSTLWSDDKSQVHRFSLEGEPSYGGSVSFDGHLGWTNPEFRIREQGDVLTLVTSQWENGQPTHHLMNFRISGNQLDLLARLPDSRFPQAIGKPGEDVYAVRIEDNKVYIVTFERTDPLYIIDNTDATQPFPSGELEVTGFSTYLHPVADDLLVGLGYEANEQGQRQGLKVALYQDQDGTPVEINSVVLGDYGWSPATFDHHAFTVLTLPNGTIRFTIPVQVWSQTDQGHQGLELFEVHPQTPELVHASTLALEDEGYWWWNYRDRSILQGDAVHYVKGQKVFSRLWQNQQPVLELTLAD